MSQTKYQYRVAVITASDKGYMKKRIDTSGPAIIEIVKKNNYLVTDYVILPDDQKLLSEKMKSLADEDICDLILTTGGTGCSPRDVTPEATKEVRRKYLGLQKPLEVIVCRLLREQCLVGESPALESGL